MIKVAVLGACGRMGREVIKAVVNAGDMELVGSCDNVFVGDSIGRIVGVDGVDSSVEVDFEAMLNRAKPNVVIDFAKPFVLSNALTAIRSGAVPIIGTTGLSSKDLDELKNAADESGVAAMVIPNFALGAVLMMKFAAQAAKYMPNVEIIELHHDQKIDAPSGTAIKTAEMIEDARNSAGVKPDKPAGMDDPARGDKCNDIQIHSVRLPGLVAHQEVLFGGTGQILTIRHDSIDRTCFMPGVLLAVRAAANSNGLIYGLDKLL